MLTKAQFESLPNGSMVVMTDRRNGYRWFFHKDPCDTPRLLDDGYALMGGGIVKNLSDMSLPTEADLRRFLNDAKKRYEQSCEDIQKSYNLATEVNQ